MEKAVRASIEEHFGNLSDPRIERTKLHKLIDILVIAICGVICNVVLKSVNVGQFQTYQPTLSHLRGFENWKKLLTVSRIRSQRWIGEEKTCEDRFYIASILGAKQVLAAVRSHWGIENGLHWTLDMAFDEDHSRIRKDNGPQNFAILRHIALNLLKQEKTSKHSIHGKRLLACWKEDYWLKVLFGISHLSI